MPQDQPELPYWLPVNAAGLDLSWGPVVYFQFATSEDLDCAVNRYRREVATNSSEANTSPATTIRSPTLQCSWGMADLQRVGRAAQPPSDGRYPKSAKERRAPRT